eukprot:1159977-Pelagomonas_calceolata.AAC.4
MGAYDHEGLTHQGQLLKGVVPVMRKKRMDHHVQILSAHALKAQKEKVRPPVTLHHSIGQCCCTVQLLAPVSIESRKGKVPGMEP